MAFDVPSSTVNLSVNNNNFLTNQRSELLNKRLQTLRSRINQSKHTLSALPFDENYTNIKRDLSCWKTSMIDKINMIHDQTLEELDTSYNQLDCYRNTIQHLIDDQLSKQLDSIQNNNSSSLSIRKTVDRLNQLQDEISVLKCLSFKLNSEHAQIVGQLNLSKCTEHKHRTPVQIDYFDESFKCRFLISKSSALKLIENNNYTNFIEILERGVPECVLITTFDLVEDLLTIIDVTTVGLRILLDQTFIPLIWGKLGDNAKQLKQKYQLQTIKSYPICCPKSTERVLYLEKSENTNIIQCLKEIYATCLNEPAVISTLYDPISYDRQLVKEYGGLFLDSQDERLYQEEEKQQRRYSESTADDYSTTTIYNNSYKPKIYSKDDYDQCKDENDYYRPRKTVTTDANSDTDFVCRNFLVNDKQAGIIIGFQGSRINKLMRDTGARIIIDDAKNVHTKRNLYVEGMLKDVDKCIKELAEIMNKPEKWFQGIDNRQKKTKNI
ncbi:unnamed protein product [Didymodactylos carnosus]|uniref:K Homology domain-containing protein n=1 Tax=Didymodactylos carnosus TaxID=1234261 RepID=A0A814BG39_9BILA|nr:unnamed protein product [Didymodactylos carnosus]CAF0927820.1 unnamed protein product [Didymodactylos carnosus]CAF3619351.1 unnamed protein product [Didymodactylos carnosus]CAF3706225.1 unnamed protein product [Didymodactylos carnosus]